MGLFSAAAVDVFVVVSRIPADVLQSDLPKLIELSTRFSGQEIYVILVRYGLLSAAAINRLGGQTFAVVNNGNRCNCHVVGARRRGGRSPRCWLDFLATICFSPTYYLDGH